MALTDHARGYLVTLAGVAIITPDTLLIRLAAVEPFTLAVMRGLMGGVMVLTLSALWYRRGFAAQLRGLGFWALVVALLQGVGLILFITALDYTSAANVLIFFATTPLIAAAMAWAFLGERVLPVTWAAILVSLAGLAIVVSGSLGAGHLIGDALALLDAISLAAFYVVLALPLAAFPVIAPLQWLWIALGGLLVVPFGLMLLTLGPRYLAAPEVAVLMLLETVIGPFWVWLVLAEEPGTRSLIGGAIIVTALFLHALVCLRSGQQESGPGARRAG